MKGKLILTDITRYDDVETGSLVLTVGEKSKRWPAIWLTNLHIQWQSINHLPAGRYPLSISSNNRWLQCPRMKVTRLVSMWIEPLDAECWQDMGVNLYLTDKPESLQPLQRNDFLLFVDALGRFEIKELTITPVVTTIHQNLFYQDSYQNFWD